jgi:hypothetical protein
LDNSLKISFRKALEMVKKTEGYKTDLNSKNTFCPGWIEPDKKAKRIKFRFYKGVNGFSWSEWYDIE